MQKNISLDNIAYDTDFTIYYIRGGIKLAFVLAVISYLDTISKHAQG